MCFNHRVCIAVEGVTDVWRLGPQAFSVFGTQYKIEQVLAASARCRSVAVVFDAERPAQTQARKLAAQLRAVGTIAWVYKLPTGLDPGALSPDEAQELVQQIERTAESVG